MGRRSPFSTVEVGEMEGLLQAHQYRVPPRGVVNDLSLRFSASADRAGKVEVSAKQISNWFCYRAKAARDQTIVRSPLPTQPQALPQTPSTTVRSVPQVPHPVSTPSSKCDSDDLLMEFEAKSGRDGAWYVASFLSHRSSETGDLDVLVRFSGLGSEEDEWVNVRKHVRRRSLPCESSDCVAISPGDLILCFQEGKNQALYFDAHVLDVQRLMHDVRGCRCRFLVRYDHDQSEEIVPLRKICRRPETDYRLQQLRAMPANGNSKKAVDINDQATTSESKLPM